MQKETLDNVILCEEGQQVGGRVVEGPWNSFWSFEFFPTKPWARLAGEHDDVRAANEARHFRLRPLARTGCGSRPHRWAIAGRPL